MDVIVLAQGSYAKIKVTVPDTDLTEASQVFVFVYDKDGRVLKKFAKVTGTFSTNVYEPVPGDAGSFFVEFLPDDTKAVRFTPKPFYCDVRQYVSVDDDVHPMNNPSYKDENIIFLLLPSVSKDVAPD